MDIINPEYVWSGLFNNRKKEIIILLFTFFSGIIIYFRMISQWITNPDGVWNGLLYKRGYEWENSLGRVGIEALNRIKGFFLYPALQTMVSLFFIAIISVLLYKIFEIEHVLWGIIIGSFLICSPSLCSTLTYYYTADAYILANVMAVLFVFILIQKKQIKNMVGAMILLALSASIYQAYVGVTITLCLLYLLYMLLIRADNWKKVLKQGFLFLFCGIGGLLLYLGGFQIYCNYYGIHPVEDRGFSSMGIIPLEKVGDLLKQAYQFFFDYYFTDALYNNTWHLRDKCNIVIFTLLIFVVIFRIIQNKLYKEVANMLLITVVILIMPLAFMSIVIMAPEVSIKDVTGILMLPHMNYLYIIFIVLSTSNWNKQWAETSFKWLSLLSSVYMILSLCFYTQIFQNCMELDLNKSYSLAQRIVESVESMPGYQSGMKVMIGGRAELGNYPRSYPEMYSVVSGTAVEYGYFWNSINGRQACWNNFLKQYLGVDYGVCNLEEIYVVTESEEYKNMPLFPLEGSVQMMNDIVIVKLSD